jgi:thiamine pyrophosphate-dependent acetolactate synthase large subunit-like protein
MSGETRISCARAVLDRLADHGIDTVFGIPGVHTLELYRAIQQTPLRHVAVRHEQGAAFMADGYARIKGKPAACLLITGPGLLNAGTAIGEAYSDSVPMVVLATVNARADLGVGRGELHELRDQRRAMEGIVAAAATIHDAAAAAPLIDGFFGRLATQRPRPVYLELPLDVAAAETVAAARPAPLPLRPAPQPAAIAELKRRVEAARRPFLILGGGARGAAEPARKLALRLGAVVATSTAGKGILDETLPPSLGATLGTPETHELLAEADLVIACGTELSRTDHWTDRLPIRGDLVRIDIDGDGLLRDYVPALAIAADAATTLAALLAALGDGEDRACWVADLEARRAALAERFRRTYPAHCRWLEALQAALPPDGIVVTDMTQLAYVGNEYYRCRRPGTWHHPVGFGTLGFALPAAIGAKIAAPDRAVVALAGDYGVGFTIQELATAAELDLSLPLLVWNNAALGAIVDGMRSAEIARIAVSLKPPRFADLARAFDSLYERLEEPAALGPALARALAAGRPTVIEIAAPPAAA